MMTPATGARLLTATALLCACAPTLPAAGQAAADPRDERITRGDASRELGCVNDRGASRLARRGVVDKHLGAYGEGRGGRRVFALDVIGKLEQAERCRLGAALHGRLSDRRDPRAGRRAFGLGRGGRGLRR